MHWNYPSNDLEKETQWLYWQLHGYFIGNTSIYHGNYCTRKPQVLTTKALCRCSFWVINYSNRWQEVQDSILISKFSRCHLQELFYMYQNIRRLPVHRPYSAFFFLDKLMHTCCLMCKWHFGWMDGWMESEEWPVAITLIPPTCSFHTIHESTGINLKQQ